MMKPEERSFLPRPAPMGEMRPFDVEGVTVKEGLRMVARAIYQTHSCVEQGIAKHDTALEIADMKRDALAAEVRNLKIALGVEKPIGDVNVPQAVTRAKMSWSEHLKIAGTVGGSLAGVAALYKFLVTIWPAVDAYLRAL
jgi:hypothetical protein